jgi:hypothetical protein
VWLWYFLEGWSACDDAWVRLVKSLDRASINVGMCMHPLTEFTLFRDNYIQIVVIAWMRNKPFHMNLWHDWARNGMSLHMVLKGHGATAFMAKSSERMEREH